MLRNLSVRRKGLLVLALPLVVATLVLAVLHDIGRSLDRSLRWALHSQQVLTTIEQATSELVAIHGENLQLALIGVSENEFQIQDRVDAARAALARLAQLLADNREQTDLLREFAPRVEALLTDLVETHQVLRDGDLKPGSTRSAENDRRLLDVTRIADDLRVGERRLQLERFEQVARLGKQRSIALVAGGALFLVGGVWLGWRLLHSMIRRMLVVRENVQHLADDEELAPPIPARDEIGQIDLAVHRMVRALRSQRSDNEMFIYSVSHDLRSPLVNLQGFGKELEAAAAELRALLDTGDADEAGRERVRRIVTEEMPEALAFIDLAVQRQSRIIDSLLSLSRAGRVEYRWDDIDLGQCLDSLAAQYRRAEGGLELTLASLPSVRGDRDALERLFDNLLGNAVKYLDPARAGRIEVGARDEGNGNVVVFVRDNGVGIEPQDLDRVFLPFTRLAGGEGEGIGLSLVRRVVDRHHGSIWIESDPGVGTTVFVRLPTARPASAR
ncbi:MAG: HAMP domain-containing histidine kinase [Planctomycetes bacterium]|nr:HAMP domain-containing histidine kinase [Planctomycetota bacterium]